MAMLAAWPKRFVARTKVNSAIGRFVVGEKACSERGSARAAHEVQLGGIQGYSVQNMDPGLDCPNRARAESNARRHGAVRGD